jgi:hypothetical protein
MALDKRKGKKNQLTRQIGEHLVVAELGKRGYISTPFAGNVTDFDLIAVSPKGKAFPIQVKAIQGSSWQFDIDKFLQIELSGDTQQVKGKAASVNRKLICIFVQIEPQPDTFFIFNWGNLQDHFFATYKSRRRPKNPKSLHCAVWPKDLQRFKDNWQILPK